MTDLSLGAAARLTGTSKSTLTRAIRAGRLSARRDDFGQYRIDPSELTRVYPVKELGEPVAVKHHATPGPDPQVAVLEAELRGLRELLAEMRQDRDRWIEQAQRLALPKPDATAPPRPVAPHIPAKSRRSWFPWRRAG